GSVIKDTVNVVLFPQPVAAFYPTPDTILGGGFVNFVNLTTNANNYIWNLGDGSNSTDTTPFHEYIQAGTYIVTLIATNTFGCRDTLTKDVYVLEKLVVPNIFTPNGDGINDVFHVEAGSMQTYDIQIFNRWGQKMFEATSPNIDWTGRSTSGVLEADGTYYYIIKATDFDGKQFSLDGYFQLIR
ncbi:MAG TPA: gliding motility-associated C-terminal domain-containing protein, partial [Bacteroidia bacterium]|nr:gliding motility-associated C-terminal domain-containing protein [Bacteroidia bacterium]